MIHTARRSGVTAGVYHSQRFSSRPSVLHKRALYVGIDHYATAPLGGCVEDVERLRGVLDRDHDGSPNFSGKSLVAPRGHDGVVTKATLREHVEDLFGSPADVALFYFSGHGTANNLGGYLVTQDAQRYDEGLAMNAVLQLATSATFIKEVFIVLDCCHSGALGDLPHVNNTAALREGVTVLTASRSTQPAMETAAGGRFTGLVCDALAGGAADIRGRVTAADVYAYVEGTLDAWEQRPLYKAHVSRLLPLRCCRPSVPDSTLRKLPALFADADAVLQLGRSYEPTEKPHHEENEQTFGELQKLRAVRLVEPVGEEHMYYAAMNGTGCRLTPLGRHFWTLANNGSL